MLSCEEIVEIFRTHVPEEIDIQVASRKEFISSALNNIYVQRQIEVGIYTDESIWTDFLSPVCSYSKLNRMVICYDLLVDHCEGVQDTDLIQAYITMMALHEAHHFHVNDMPHDFKSHIEAEMECVRKTTETNMDLSDMVERFENQSVVYQRVYNRLRPMFPSVFS